MKKTPRIMPLIAIGIYLMAFFTNNARAEELMIGNAAPEFELIDQYKKTHTLADYRGTWVVLYFYPKDDTPGCTTEACNFRDDIVQIRGLGAEVIGVSVDNAESHAKFAEKHGLPFPLLSDPDGACASSYGSYWSMGPLKFAKRHTFIIDQDGNIAKIYRDVNAKEHSQQIIDDLKSLTHG